MRSIALAGVYMFGSKFLALFLLVLATFAFADETSNVEAALASPPGRLSLFLYGEVLSLYVANHPERSALFENFIGQWNAALNADSSLTKPRPNEAILKQLLAKPEMEPVKLVVNMGFAPPVHSTLSKYLNLDGYSPSSRRYLEALKATHNLANNPVARPAAVAIANTFINSKDLALKTEAKKILEECAAGFASDDKFDPLALENFLGGTLVAKTALRFGWWQAGVKYFKELSVFSKSIFASVGIHVAVLEQTLNSNTKTKDEKLRGQNSPITKTIIAKEKASTPALAIVAPEAFVKRIQGLLQSGPVQMPEIADQFAEIFFIAEMIEHIEGRVNLQISTIDKLGDFTRIQRMKDQLSKQFDEYMRERGLQKMDAKALAKLRQLLTPIVPIYGLEKQLWLPTLLGARGNCVARALLFLAFYYPIYLKYKPDDIEFGLQLYTDHVESVLYNVNSQVAIAVMTLQPVAKDKMVNIMYPETILPTYLARRTRLEIPTVKNMTLCTLGQPCQGATHALKRYWDRKTEPSLGLPLIENVNAENKVNKSPFFSTFYAAQMEYGTPGETIEDDFSVLNPNEDLSDFEKGKGIAPATQGPKPPAPSKKVLDSIVTVISVENESSFPIFNGDELGFSAVRPHRPSDEEITNAVKRVEELIEDIKLELPNFQFDRNVKNPNYFRDHSNLRQLLKRAPNSQPYDSNKKLDLTTILLDYRQLKDLDPTTGLAIKASNYWKSTTDFAKYATQMSCELIQSPNMLKVTAGDEAAFDSLTLSEIAGIENINSAIFNYQLKSKSSEEVMMINFIREGTNFYGWEPLAKAIARIADLKLRKMFSGDPARAMGQFLEVINRDSTEEAHRKLALFLFAAKYQEPLSFTSSPNKTTVEISAITLITNSLNRLEISLKKSDPKANAGRAEGPSVPKNIAQPVLTTQSPPLQIRLISPQGGQKKSAEYTDPVSIQLRPEIFLELILSEEPWFFDRSNLLTMTAPLSQLLAEDFAKFEAHPRINQRQRLKDPLLMKWMGILDEYKLKRIKFREPEAVQKAAVSASILAIKLIGRSNGVGEIKIENSN